MFTPIPGEMIQFDEHISFNGLKPPTHLLDFVQCDLPNTPRKINMEPDYYPQLKRKIS